MSVNPVTQKRDSLIEKKHKTLETEKPALWKTILCAALTFGSPVNAASSCPNVRDFSLMQSPLTCPVTFGYAPPIPRATLSFWNRWYYQSADDGIKLHNVIRDGHVIEAQILLNKGIAPTALDIKHAIQNADLEMVKLLCEHGIDLEKLGYFFDKAIDRYENDKHFKTEPIFNADIIFKNEPSWKDRPDAENIRHKVAFKGFHTPLSFAVELARYKNTFQSYFSIVECLLQAGASPDTPFWDIITEGAQSPITSINGMPVFQICEEKLLYLLLEYSAAPNDLLSNAITDGKYELAGKILSMNKNVPSDLLFKKGTYPFVDPLDEWRTILGEYGIGMIIEKIDGEEFMRFTSIEKKASPEDSELLVENPKLKALRKGARHLDLGRRISEEMKQFKEKEKPFF